MDKKHLFTITAKDCRWDYYVGSGKGGQHRNKTANCVRCTHIESGAVACSEEGRSQRYNREQAFKKMAETKVFTQWVNMEVCRLDGTITEVEKKVEQAMKEIRVEVKEQDKWIDWVW